MLLYSIVDFVLWFLKEPVMKIKPASVHTKTQFLLSAVASALLMSYGRSSYAACSLVSGTYQCSGAETTTRTLSGSPLNVTLDDTFSMNAIVGHGLDLTGTGGLLLMQDPAGLSITGASNAINAINNFFD